MTHTSTERVRTTRPDQTGQGQRDRKRGSTAKAETRRRRQARADKRGGVTR